MEEIDMASVQDVKAPVSENHFFLVFFQALPGRNQSLNALNFPHGSNKDILGF